MIIERFIHPVPVDPEPADEMEPIDYFRDPSEDGDEGGGAGGDHAALPQGAEGARGRRSGGSEGGVAEVQGGSRRGVRSLPASSLPVRTPSSQAR